MSTKQYKNKNAISWRCFFCDEVFKSREKAALHFGCFDSCEPDTTACKLLSHQEKILEYVRGLEDEIKQYQSENIPLLQAMWVLEADMATKVKEAENNGYAKGVADMKAQGYCVEPAKHDHP